MSKIYRLHYRTQLKEACSQTDLKAAVEVCRKQVRGLQKQERVLTAALYCYDRMLFLYYEAIGGPVAVTEPAGAEQMTAQKTDRAGENMILESGEDIQAAVVYPAEFLSALQPYLQAWPGQRADRFWVHMYHIFYHSIPGSPEDWKRAAVPEKRWGRIAFLRADKLFSYTYYHRAIVEEGLLSGDKYQSIALHENILFSYFEEPKTMTNVRNRPDGTSQVMQEWLAAGPESHFIHMPQGDGGNFMFLPALFALGVEDKDLEV